MKLAIISDSHDNLATIKKALQIINKEKIETLLHCGDICSPSTLKTILEGFKGNVHIVFGNVDGDYFKTKDLTLKNSPNFKAWGDLGEMKIDGKNIAFLHSPQFAKELAVTQKYDLVFYGHTHKPWKEKIGKTILVNPGNLAGIIFKATFALYDTENDKLELKILNENL